MRSDNGEGSGANDAALPQCRLWHDYSMPTATKPEPKPFEKFQQFAKQVLSVPKKEIDRREAEYQKARAVKKST